jgi:hypothetical protein
MQVPYNERNVPQLSGSLLCAWGSVLKNAVLPANQADIDNPSVGDGTKMSKQKSRKE